MNTPPRRSVVLRYGASSTQLRADADAEQVEAMQVMAERMGLPRHPDPDLAALLAAVRLRDDIPSELYAALSAVLAGVYDASSE